jgi:hypothetical protein
LSGSRSLVSGSDLRLRNGTPDLRKILSRRLTSPVRRLRKDATIWPGGCGLIPSGQQAKESPGFFCGAARVLIWCDGIRSGLAHSQVWPTICS